MGSPFCHCPPLNKNDVWVSVCPKHPFCSLCETTSCLCDHLDFEKTEINKKKKYCRYVKKIHLSNPESLFYPDERNNELKLMLKKYPDKIKEIYNMFDEIFNDLGEDKMLCDSAVESSDSTDVL